MCLEFLAADFFPTPCMSNVSSSPVISSLGSRPDETTAFCEFSPREKLGNGRAKTEYVSYLCHVIIFTIHHTRSRVAIRDSVQHTPRPRAKLDMSDRASIEYETDPARIGLIVGHIAIARDNRPTCSNLASGRFMAVCANEVFIMQSLY